MKKVIHQCPADITFDLEFGIAEEISPCFMIELALSLDKLASQIRRDYPGSTVSLSRYRNTDGDCYLFQGDFHLHNILGNAASCSLQQREKDVETTRLRRNTVLADPTARDHTENTLAFYLAAARRMHSSASFEKARHGTMRKSGVLRAAIAITNKLPRFRTIPMNSQVERQRFWQLANSSTARRTGADGCLVGPAPVPDLQGFVNFMSASRLLPGLLISKAPGISRSGNEVTVDPIGVAKTIWGEMACNGNRKHFLSLVQPIDIVSADIDHKVVRLLEKVCSNGHLDSPWPHCTLPISSSHAAFPLIAAGLASGMALVAFFYFFRKNLERVTSQSTFTSSPAISFD